MKIELRKIKYSPSLSQETNAFTADIYADGVKIGYAENDGHGGSTMVRSAEGGRDLFEKAIMFCKSLPKKTYNFEGMDPFEEEVDLEGYVDDLLTEHLIVLDIKKTITKIDNLSKKKWIIISRKELEDFRNGKSNNLGWKELKANLEPSKMNKETFDIVKLKVEGHIKPNTDEFVYNTFSVK